jgi:hypothetical protein
MPAIFLIHSRVVKCFLCSLNVTLTFTKSDLNLDNLACAAPLKAYKMNILAANPATTYQIIYCSGR